MIQFTDLLRRFRTKRNLIILAGSLLLVNAAKFGVDYFEERKVHVMSRLDLLEQYRESAAELDGLKENVQRLEKRKEELDVFLFTGGSEEEIASSMQILLQEKVAKAGLAPESIRPVTRSEKDKSDDRDIGDVAVKMRLSGTLIGFMELIADIYRSNRLFRIETFVLKPYKGEELKILLDLQGYYKVNKEGKTSPPASGKRPSEPDTSQAKRRSVPVT